MAEEDWREILEAKTPEFPLLISTDAMVKRVIPVATRLNMFESMTLHDIVRRYYLVIVFCLERTRLLLNVFPKPKE